MLTLKCENASILGNTGVLPTRVVALIRERQRRLAAIPLTDSPHIRHGLDDPQKLLGACLALLDEC